MAARPKPYIINDQTPDELLYPRGLSRGLDPGPGYGSAAGYGIEEFPRDLLIPEADWPGLIRDRKTSKSTLRDLAYRRGPVKIKDQDGLPYCWIFATTTAFEIARVVANEPHVPLSPASCGAKITGYRRRGGYGREAIEGIEKYGLVPSSLWPDVAVRQSLDTAEARAEAARYRATEWWYLPSWPAIVSAILRGFAASVGLNWWGHQVCYLDLSVIDGEVCPDFANSWGEQYGDRGFGTLQGRRKYPADGVCPRVALAA